MGARVVTAVGPVRSTSVELRNQKPALVSLERFPVAGHVESWNADSSRYAAVLQDFLAPVAP